MYGKIELTDPSQEQIAKAWREVGGWDIDLYMLQDAYQCMSTMPYGEVGTSNVHGYRMLISWEWISGRQEVMVRKVVA